MCYKNLKHVIRYLFIKCIKMFKKTRKFITCKLCLSITTLVTLIVILHCISQSDVRRADFSSKQHTVLPTIVWWTKFGVTKYHLKCPVRKVSCHVVSRDDLPNEVGNVDAYLFYGSELKFDDLPLPRRPQKIIWGLLHEESPRNIAELLHDEVLTLFNYSSTFSRYSNVPFPLHYLPSEENISTKKYYVETAVKNSYMKELAPVMYLQSDCETATERDKYVEKLMQYMKIDSYGKCLKNKQLPFESASNDNYIHELYNDQILSFMGKYKFVISIENGICEDYITEKFWRPIIAGAVPIYFGSPSIRDWIPNNKSAIFLEDFPTPKLMSEHIKKLLNNDELYEEYLEHKTKGLILNERLIRELRERSYQKDFENIVTEFQCFICQELYNKTVSSVVNKSHYNCPLPKSALTLRVNTENSWLYFWHQGKVSAEMINLKVQSRN